MFCFVFQEGYVSCWHSFEPWHTWLSVTLMNETKCSWIQDSLVTAFPWKLWLTFWHLMSSTATISPTVFKLFHFSEFPRHCQMSFPHLLLHFNVNPTFFTISNLYFNFATVWCLPTSIQLFVLFSSQPICSFCFYASVPQEPCLLTSTKDTEKFLNFL